MFYSMIRLLGLVSVYSLVLVRITESYISCVLLITAGMATKMHIICHCGSCSGWVESVIHRLLAERAIVTK